MPGEFSSTTSRTLMAGHGVAAYFASPPPSLPRRSEGLATRKGAKKSRYRRACHAGAVFGPERAVLGKHRSAQASRVVAKEGGACPCSGPQTSLRRVEPPPAAKMLMMPVACSAQYTRPPILTEEKSRPGR